MSKSDIECKAMAYDAFIESQQYWKARGRNNMYISGAVESLQTVYNAIKSTEASKESRRVKNGIVEQCLEKELPRIRCKGNALYLPQGGSTEMMAELLDPGDTLTVWLNGYNRDVACNPLYTSTAEPWAAVMPFKL